MAEIAIPEKYLPALRLALFWIGLPSVLLLGALDRYFAGTLYEVAACFVGALVSIAIAVYWDRIIDVIWPRHTRPLQYLSYRDSDLGSAIMNAARLSAYGRWFAAQILVNSGNPIQHRHLLHVMAGQVMDKILDGEIEVRGRKPGQMEYEAIPRTYWRSTAFYVVEDQLALWRIVLCPRGGVELAADGTVIRATDAASLARTSQLNDYDSLLVDAYQFEKVWPRRNRLVDRDRRRFLRTARNRSLDKNEILRLSDPPRKLWPVLFVTAAVAVVVIYVGGPEAYRWAMTFMPVQAKTAGGFTQEQVDAKIAAAVANLKAQLNDAQKQITRLLDAQKAVSSSGGPRGLSQTSSNTQGPVTWYTDSQLLVVSGSSLNAVVHGVLFMGKSNRSVAVKEAYVISGLTGHKQEVMANVHSRGSYYPVDKVDIPPNAPVQLDLVFNPPLSVRDFLDQWGKFRFTVVYVGGETFERDYDEDYVRQQLQRNVPDAFGPRVTPRDEK
jgi:hypothetical protein